MNNNLYPIWFRHLEDTFESKYVLSLLWLTGTSFQKRLFFLAFKNSVSMTFQDSPFYSIAKTSRSNSSVRHMIPFVINHDILLSFISDNEVVSFRTCSHGNMASSHYCYLYSCLDFWDFSFREKKWNGKIISKLN